MYLKYQSNQQSLRAKKGEVAMVIADYEATGGEQLSLKKGQLIMIRKRSDSGWWEGELQVINFRCLCRSTTFVEGWLLNERFSLFSQKDVNDKSVGSLLAM